MPVPLPSPVSEAAATFEAKAAVSWLSLLPIPMQRVNTPSHSLRQPEMKMLFHPLPLAHLLPGGSWKGSTGMGNKTRYRAVASPSLNQSIIRALQGGPLGAGSRTLGCSLSPSARNSAMPLDTAASPRTSLLQAFGPMPKL